MSEPAEDLQYSVGPAAQPEEAKPDSDYNNLPLLRKHLKDIDALIAKHNTLDVIVPNHKLSGEQQIAVNKELVVYLKQFREETVEKIKELRNGQ